MPLATCLLACLIVGDSIAARIAPYTACVVDAQNSLHSEQIIERVRPAPLVIISAGSNDTELPYRLRLKGNIEAIRAKAAKAAVIWILPNDTWEAAIVQEIARAHGDRTVDFVSDVDHIHPDCPQCVANEIHSLACPAPPRAPR